MVQKENNHQNYIENKLRELKINLEFISDIIFLKKILSKNLIFDTSTTPGIHMIPKSVEKKWRVLRLFHNENDLINYGSKIFNNPKKIL